MQRMVPALQPIVAAFWKTTVTNPLNLSASVDVTGRDYDIFAKALAYAITTIDSLPRIRQEASDCDDMRRLLAAMRPNAKWHHMEIMAARQHMGFEQFFLDFQDHLRHLH